jgi:hypothetical protein
MQLNAIAAMTRAERQNEKVRGEVARELERIDAEIARLHVIRAKLLGTSEPASASESDNRPRSPGGKRDRRSDQDLAAVANDLVKVIKQAGKTGLSGDDLRDHVMKRHGGYVLPAIKPFLDKFAKTHGVKVMGKKEHARYVPS